MKEENSNIYIYGRNSVMEAINADSDIQKIFFCFGANAQNILLAAKRKKINCTTLDKNKFRELEKKACAFSAKTQGVVALKQIIDIVDIDDFLATINIEKHPIIAILDGISDPQNLGAIARSAECAGLSAIILPNKNSAPITPVAIKASAGVLNYFPVIQVTNLLVAVEKLKKNNFWVIGTQVDAKQNYYDNIYDKPVAIVIGAEGKGMSPSLAKHCDHLVKIDMFGNINSLNASVSAGIIFFEILRQRGIKYTVDA